MRHLSFSIGTQERRLIWLEAFRQDLTDQKVIDQKDAAPQSQEKQKTAKEQADKQKAAPESSEALNKKMEALVQSRVKTATENTDAIVKRTQEVSTRIDQINRQNEAANKLNDSVVSGITLNPSMERMQTTRINAAAPATATAQANVVTANRGAEGLAKASENEQQTKKVAAEGSNKSLEEQRQKTDRA